MRLVETIEAEIREFKSAVEKRQHELQLELCAALLHRQDMAKQAKHLEVRTIYCDVGTFQACAGPKADDGSFWVGVGPENRLLVAYEYVQVHRHTSRTGRFLGKPIPSPVAEGYLLKALDKAYGRLPRQPVDGYAEMMRGHQHPDFLASFPEEP